MLSCKTHGFESILITTFQKLIGLHSIQLHRLRQQLILLEVQFVEKGTPQMITLPENHQELWHTEIMNGV